MDTMARSCSKKCSDFSLGMDREREQASKEKAELELKGHGDKENHQDFLEEARSVNKSIHAEKHPVQHEMDIDELLSDN